jgi:hypothetical protein
MRPSQEAANSLQLMATVRRLKAALAPSVLPVRVPDQAVAAEVTRMLESDSLANLLSQCRPGYFYDVLLQARGAAAAGRNPREIIELLWALLESQDLDAALATADPNEQPAHLIKLMLDGPYKNSKAISSRRGGQTPRPISPPASEQNAVPQLDVLADTESSIAR